MKAIGSHLDLRSTARTGFSRRVEKTNESGKLGDDSLRQAVPPVRFFERRQSRRSSRFDTRLSYDPEQSGTPACFVAQVLGQILDAGRHAPVAAARVYARGGREQKRPRVVSTL